MVTDYTYTSTAYGTSTVTMNISFSDDGELMLRLVDPIAGHEREVGIRAAIDYLNRHGKPAYFDGGE